jgi:hypothetical protein
MNFGLIKTIFCIKALLIIGKMEKKTMEVITLFER